MKAPPASLAAKPDDPAPPDEAGPGDEQRPARAEVAVLLLEDLFVEGVNQSTMARVAPCRRSLTELSPRFGPPWEVGGALPVAGKTAQLPRHVPAEVAALARRCVEPATAHRRSPTLEAIRLQARATDRQQGSSSGPASLAASTASVGPPFCARYPPTNWPGGGLHNKGAGSGANLSPSSADGGWYVDHGRMEHTRSRHD
jgi:hypothetical protein